jgi:hypothetical protein
MAFPQTVTENEAYCLDSMPLVALARILGTFVHTLQWLIDEHELPTVEIGEGLYVHYPTFLAWAELQDWKAIWETCDPKYRICIKRCDTGLTDPMRLGEFGSDCPPMFASGEWWRH